jgi:hypothetical protein
MRFGQIGIQLQGPLRSGFHSRINIGGAERRERAENGICIAQTCPGLRERRIQIESLLEVFLAVSYGCIIPFLQETPERSPPDEQ